MKNKLFKKIIIGLLLTLFVTAGLALPAFAYSSQLQKLTGGFAEKSGSLQGYVDETLAPNAGAPYADWLFIALKRHDASLDVGKYVFHLNSASGRKMNNTEKERIALAYTAAGVKNGFVESALASDFGSTGINGLVYGLILLDSGAYESPKNDRNALINEILEAQLADGGWALFGNYHNIDITAMTLQALAPYKKFDDVSAAVSKALALLSSRQLADGGYDSLGTPTCESTAQVVIALNTLGINPATDARFIKNGKTALDALEKYQLSDGSYSHFQGSPTNAIATAQAACALVSTECGAAGKSPLYVFTSAVVERVMPPAQSSGQQSHSETAPQKAESSASPSASAEESGVFSAQSAESSEQSVTDPVTEGIHKATKKISYKYFACGAVILIFIIVSVVLFAKGKGKLKNILPLGLVAILLIYGILFINVTSVKNHYSAASEASSNGSVTISVDCHVLDSVEPNLENGGVILHETKIAIEKDDVVFDVLIAATRRKHIKVDYTGTPENLLSGVYVSGIDNLIEMQYGPLSGWTYTVNGKSPDIGCGAYKVADGDVICFAYTLDLGKDVQENE